MNEPDEPLEMINIKIDLEDPNSVAQAFKTLTTECESVRLVGLILSTLHRLGRAEMYARRLEALFIAFGAILGGALAVSVYYNIT